MTNQRKTVLMHQLGIFQFQKIKTTSLAILNKKKIYLKNIKDLQILQEAGDRLKKQSVETQWTAEDQAGGKIVFYQE